MTNIAAQSLPLDDAHPATPAAKLPPCAVVPPSWPLHRWIAVNPWWGLRHLPAEAASQVPGVRPKTSIFMPVSFYRDAWIGGRIQEQDLLAAAKEQGAGGTVQQWLSVLERSDGAPIIPAPLALELCREAHHEPALEAVCEQVARACALYFDKRQSRGFVRGLASSLFESWLEQASHDLSLDQRTELKGARKTLAKVSRNYQQAYDWANKIISLNDVDLECLANRLLFELVGWSSLCRGLEWREALEGRESAVTEQMLAVLFVWEAVALALASPDQRHQWQRAWGQYRKNVQRAGSANGQSQAQRVWHRAFELGYQRQLCSALARPASADEKENLESSGVAVQAVFCIDVRSEVLRRHLEACSPKVQTLGFAGFFGVPIEHQTLTSAANQARLPGLLAPVYRLVDSTGNPREDWVTRRSAENRETVRQSVRKAKYSSFSSFTLVESTGLAWAWKLIKDSLNKPATKEEDERPLSRRFHHRHGGDPVADSDRVTLAENLLRGMSKTSDFAPLLVLVGHGSHSDNNPHQASLACGACGGQNGGLNASAAAELINEPVIRAGLVSRGIRIPDFTLAVAAEHCTVTDRVRILERERIPTAYLSSVIEFEEQLAEASQAARRERATVLGLNGLNDDALLQAMQRRTTNWSEVRPEWGLANNAAIVFAKRARTRGTNLHGRVFLHDYDPDQDPNGQILEALMTAPLVVANWINLQYLGSVAAPDTFGAGNKLLHSVVGGNLGVVEGNHPDLRLGLSMQSVHDGQRWRHEPIRLHVVIDAPAERIEAILSRQSDVRQLVDNRWLWLFRWGEQGLERYHNGCWSSVAGDSEEDFGGNANS